MRDKEYLRIMPDRIRWQIKGMKTFFYIPHLILCILQPIYIYLVLWVGYGFENTYVFDEITSAILGLYPPLSLWWALWILKKYLEDDERELYYVNEKIKWTELFIYYMIYVFLASFMLLIYAHWIGIKQSLYLLLCVAALGYFYHASAYCLAYTAKSATIVLIPLLLYTFGVMSPYQYSMYKISYFRLFYGDYFKGILWSLGAFAAGAAFIQLGKRENKKYNRY